MNYKTLKSDKHATLEVTNEKLDSSISAEIKSALVDLNNQGFKNLVMDLSAVKYCDSSGLSSILVANRLCKNAQGLFVVAGLNEMVSKLITLSQLDSILKIVSNKEEASKIILP
jgi:anti-anti-sigma factor